MGFEAGFLRWTLSFGQIPVWITTMRGRRDSSRGRHFKMTSTEPLTGIQREGCSCRNVERDGYCETFTAIRRPSGTDPRLEETVLGGGDGGIRWSAAAARPSTLGRTYAAAREDRRTYDGEGFFSQGTRSHLLTERRAVVLSEYPLPVVRQCRLLNLLRSFFYYRPASASGDNLELLRRIDAIHLGYPEVSGRWEFCFANDQARERLLFIESVDGEEPGGEDSE